MQLKSFGRSLKRTSNQDIQLMLLSCINHSYLLVRITHSSSFLIFSSPHSSLRPLPPLSSPLTPFSFVFFSLPYFFCSFLTIGFCSVFQVDSLQIFDISSKELAKQLAIISLGFMRNIQPSELLHWNAQKEKAKNLALVVENFNNLTQWAKTLIVTGTPSMTDPGFPFCLLLFLFSLS